MKLYQKCQEDCASAVITSLYLAGGVVTKIRGPKLHEVLIGEDADSVAVLGAISFRDGICSPLIWRETQFTIQSSR